MHFFWRNARISNPWKTFNWTGTWVDGMRLRGTPWSTSSSLPACGPTTLSSTKTQQVCICNKNLYNKKVFWSWINTYTVSYLSFLLLLKLVKWFKMPVDTASAFFLKFLSLFEILHPPPSWKISAVSDKCGCKTVTIEILELISHSKNFVTLTMVLKGASCLNSRVVLPQIKLRERTEIPY